MKRRPTAMRRFDVFIDGDIAGIVRDALCAAIGDEGDDRESARRPLAADAAAVGGPRRPRGDLR